MRRLACGLSYMFTDATYHLFRVKKHGVEHLKAAEKKYGKFIITGNHVFRQDGPFIARALRGWRDMRNGRLMGSWVKQEILEYPIIGPVFKETKTAVGINRRPGSLSVDVIRQTRDLLDKHQAVLIFMQGSTVRPGMRKPKTGPVRAAVATGAPIMPVGIYPTTKISLRQIWLKRAHVHLTFGKARIIPPSPDSSYRGRRKYYREQTDKLWEEIHVLVKESEQYANRH